MDVGGVGVGVGVRVGVGAFDVSVVDVGVGVGDFVGDGVKARHTKGWRSCTECKTTAGRAENRVHFLKVLIGAQGFSVCHRILLCMFDHLQGW